MSFLNLSGIETKTSNDDDKKWEPLPKGKYDLRCNEVEIGETKKKKSGEANKGRYIKAQFKVNVGEHENRVLYHYFNYENDNKQAEDIGKKQIKEFLEASNYPTPEDLENLQDMVGQVCTCVVDVEPGTGQYGPSNKIKKFLKEEKKEDGDELLF